MNRQDQEQASQEADRDHETAQDTKAAGNRDAKWAKIRKLLRVRLGEDIYVSWFQSMELDVVSEGAARVSVPVKFLKTWIQSHYSDDLLACIRSEFPEVKRTEVALRQPGSDAQQQRKGVPATEPRSIRSGDHAGRAEDGRPLPPSGPGAAMVRTSANGFEGSPLDPRFTFDSFVVGAANRMAHAAAVQVAETILVDHPRFNPLVIHSSCGLGKSHLLHAIAWDVRRRSPHANVIYLTAERFRFIFVEAIKSQTAMSFRDRFRGNDVLLVDDLEFLQGEKTEQEFDHIVNMLLDAGRQVVVAMARAPGHVTSLNERMRSRLQGGLVTEIGVLDYDLRLRILEKRVADRRAADPSFEIPREVIEFLADRLTESGRELEGAVARLYHTSRFTNTPVTLATVETMIRDLVLGQEPKRIKVDDILRTVSRHFGVSRGDIMSQRRHRSIVWPRQIGMYLAKQLTARSLPEIGRRFGGRDHTTVLHAIRKIEGEIEKKPGLREELEELKRQLNI
ncbi:MAG: chromosomal replication initiator protein DnaA [Hyphomicrobiaceae bacterium]|nr:chromosomal replication initiator protein DnaA [Hyphomicrobiaceae bacterium]